MAGESKRFQRSLAAMRGSWARLSVGIRRALGIVLVVALLGAFTGMFISHAAASKHQPAPTPTDGQLADDATPTPMATATGTSAPTATDTPTAVPTLPAVTGIPAGEPSPTATEAPLTVTDLRLTVDHPTFSGVCTDHMPFVFTAQVTVTPHSSPTDLILTWRYGGASYQITNGGQSYAWTEPSQNTDLMLAADQTSATATYTLSQPAQLGNGQQITMSVEVANQSSKRSAQTTFSFNCVRQIVSIAPFTSPTSWLAPCSTQIVAQWNFTVTFTPGPPGGEYSSNFDYSKEPGAIYGAVWSPALYPTVPWPSESAPGDWTEVTGLGGGLYSVDQVINRAFFPASPNGEYPVTLSLQSLSVPTDNAKATATLTKSC